jgi:hypothetical protein
MNRFAVLTAVLIAASACGGHPPTAPSVASSSPASTVSALSSVVHMSGLVREGDAPVAGATVTVQDCSTTPGHCTPKTVMTNPDGSYDLTGDVSLFGSATAEKTGYEPDDRYTANSYVSRNEIVANFRLYRIQRLTVGESITVTVAPGDPACGIDGEFVCRTVRIVAPLDGTLTVEATANDPAMTPGLELFWPFHPSVCCELTAFIRVAAGAEVQVNLLVPWTANVSTSFALRTSFAADSSVNVRH